jgi:(p)ppGpp synthase/HD superfamily hydrolase
MARASEQLSFARDLPVTAAAIDFASSRHAGQQRDGDNAAFVIHPLEAASILERARYPDQVIAAAVLHDVLEDTDTEPTELRARFGSEVTDLVELVSDDPRIPGEDARRDELRQRVRAAGGYALPIYCADKVSKVRELRAMIAAGADHDVVESKRSHYWKCLTMLEDEIPESPIVEFLRFELEALEVLPPQVRQGDHRSGTAPSGNAGSAQVRELPGHSA